MKIINAADMRELTNLGEKEFEKNVLEGPLFKNIISSIENAALDGYMGWRSNIGDNEEIRKFKVIQKSLIEAGYDCEITIERRFGAFNLPYMVREFKVDWSK